VEQLRFSEPELEEWLDLSPYVNEAALVTLQNTSLRRVSALFSSMGLRHLLVVESCPKVVGLITRKDVIMAGGEHLGEGEEGASTSFLPRLPSLRASRHRATRLQPAAEPALDNYASLPAAPASSRPAGSTSLVRFQEGSAEPKPATTMSEQPTPAMPPGETGASADCTKPLLSASKVG